MLTRELRAPNNPRITVKQPSRGHAWIFVDGKGVCTVSDLEYYEAYLSATEQQCGSNANGTALKTQEK